MKNKIIFVRFFFFNFAYGGNCLFRQNEDAMCYNRKIVNSVGLAIIMSIAIQLLVSVIFLFVPRTLDIKIYYLITILSLVLSLTIPFIVLINNLEISKHDVLKFEPVKIKKCFTMIFMGIVVCFCGQIISAILKLILDWFGIRSVTPEMPIANNIFDAAVQAFTIAVTPAIFEEIAFRGFILGVLRKIDDRFAIVVSAFLFGIAHGNLEQAPFAFILGLFLGVLVIKTNSLLPGMMIHFVNNLIAVSIMISKNNNIEYLQNIIGVVYLAVLFLGILAFFKKDNRDLVSIKSIESIVPAKEKLKTFFSSVWMLIYMIIICFFIFVGMKNAG